MDNSPSEGIELTAS